MKKQKGVFGVYFLKGAFFMQLKEVNDNLVMKFLVSKNSQQLPEVIGGAYEDINSLLCSKNSNIAKLYISTLDFDYMVIGSGDSATYYINTDDGLVKCNIEVYYKKK